MTQEEDKSREEFRGKPIALEVHRAIKVEFLNQWNTGRRGRQISGKTIFDGLDSSIEAPSIPSINKIVGPLRLRLEELDEEGLLSLDEPWSMKDMMTDGGITAHMHPRFLPGLLYVQRTIIQGTPIQNNPTMRGYKYWESENIPAITKREARWFSVLAPIFFPEDKDRSWREMNALGNMVEKETHNPVGIGDFSYELVELEELWEFACEYSIREQLSEVLDEPDEFIDLNLKVLQRTLNFKEEDAGAHYDDGPHWTADIATNDMGLIPTPTGTDLRGTLLGFALRTSEEFHQETSWRFFKDNSVSLLIDKKFEDRTTRPSKILNYPMTFALDNTYETDRDDRFETPVSNSLLDFTLLYERVMRKTEKLGSRDWSSHNRIEVPNINEPFEILFQEEACQLKHPSFPDDNVDYYLSSQLLRIASNQIAPEGINISRMRRVTADKATQVLLNAKRIVDHRLTCECKACIHLRKIMGITSVQNSTQEASDA